MMCTDQGFLCFNLQAEILYSKRADPGIDYFPSDSYVILNDGAMQGSIPLTIKADDIPELPELFRIQIKRVELLDGPPANPSNMPKVRQASTKINAVI